MKNPIILHVNCFEPDGDITIPEMCRKAVSWGYDGIEFRRKRNVEGESPCAYLDRISEGVEKSGMKHVMFGTPGPKLMQSDKSARQREIEECAAFYREAAGRFELSVCNTTTGPFFQPGIPQHEYDRHGSAAAAKEHWEWAVEGFSELGKLAASLGFRFAFEIHPGYLHDLPGTSKRLVSEINLENVGLNLDYGNLTAFPEQIAFEDAIKICREHLFMLHLKNAFQVPLRKYKRNICCSLADGVTDYRRFFKTLKKEMDFNGPIVIEWPRGGDREYFAEKDIEYLRELLDDIGF